MGTNQSLSALARATAPAVGLAVFSGVAYGAAFTLAAILMFASSVVAFVITQPRGVPEVGQRAEALP